MFESLRGNRLGCLAGCSYHFDQGHDRDHKTMDYDRENDEKARHRVVWAALAALAAGDLWWRLLPEPPFGAQLYSLLHFTATAEMHHPPTHQSTDYFSTHHLVLC